MDADAGVQDARKGNTRKDKELCVVINVLKSVKSDGAAFLME